MLENNHFSNWGKGKCWANSGHTRGIFEQRADIRWSGGDLECASGAPV